MFSNRKIILVILLLITLCIAGYVFLVIIPRHAVEQTYAGAKKIGKDLQEAFQFTPEITVNNTIVIKQQTAILELATMSQKFHHRYQWSNTLMGSKKEIEIDGTYEAKVGFDLNEKFSIHIADGKASVVFPEPKLLSLESLGDIRFQDQHGLWNWINEEDRSKAINAFTTDARTFAEQADFTQEAAAVMQKKLLEILRPHVDAVEITIGTTTVHRKVKGSDGELLPEEF